MFFSKRTVCIITMGIRDSILSSKMSVFDPQKGLIYIQWELDSKRTAHIAVIV